MTEASSTRILRSSDDKINQIDYYHYSGYYYFKIGIIHRMVGDTGLRMAGGAQLPRR